MLSEIEGPIAVVSIAGKFRTGKSFMLNELIRKKNAFKVEGNVEACTKGIWIWNKPIKHEHNGEMINLLLTDTEGLDADDTVVEHDFKIFTLSILTCSHFVYNSMY